MSTTSTRRKAGPVLPPPPAPGAGVRARRRTPRPLTRDEERLAHASSALMMVALVCLWVLVQILVLGGISQSRDQDLLYRDLREQLASAVGPVSAYDPEETEVPTLLEPGSPVALINIPAIGVQQVVVEGTGSGDLLAGPGHRRDTVLPGQEGTSAVYGRSLTYGGPFRRLTELRRGDEISVVSGQGRLTFTVLGVRRAGDKLPAPPAAGKARLVLTTSEGFLISPGRTVYVDAEASKAFAAPAGRPAAVPESEKAMGKDLGALPLLVLHLAVLVAMALGVIAARQRWSAALVWVVATPVVIALSWGTTDVLMRILPNLI